MSPRKKRLNLRVLLKLAEKYRLEAEKCLEARAYLAGLVSVRAALEAMLYSRLLVGILDWSAKELRKFGITVRNEVVELPEETRLWELIEEAHKARCLDRTGFAAATRIRKWGNKIHCAEVAGGTRLPSISRRNLEARLDDLDVVIEQIGNSL